MPYSGTGLSSQLRRSLQSRLSFPVGADVAKLGRYFGIDATYSCNGTLCGLSVACVKGKSETGAQPVRQQLGAQRLIPARRPQPWSPAGEDLSGHLARGGADGQCIRLHHRRGVGRERVPIRRQVARRQPEQCPKRPALGPIALALFDRERRQDQVVDGQSGVDQGGVNPAQRCDLVGAVGRAALERTDCFGQAAAIMVWRWCRCRAAVRAASSELNTIVNTTSKVRWKRPTGSEKIRECSATAAATQGCASSSSKARPAPKKVMASRSIRQVIDPGPKMPSTGPAARART